LEH
jgi:hypothetical protein